MKIVLSFFKNLVTLCAMVMMGAVLLILRYILNTPQRLESVLPGEARLYKGTYGHVYYKVSGSPETLPMVLLHAPGIGASAYEMHGIMASLAQQYRVYALDLPGFGLSDHLPINYTAATYITLFQDFLASVVRCPALLLASGLSGNYSIIVAERYPMLCEGLVLLTPPTAPTESVLEQLLVLMARLPFLRLAFYSLLSTRLVLRASLIRRYQLVDAQRCNDIIDHRFATAHQLHAYRAPLAYLAGKLNTADITASLAALQQPTLQFQGMSRSNYILQNEQGRQEQVTPHMPRPQVVSLSDARTAPHEEQPEAVVRRILEWQKSLREPEEEIEVYCVKCKQKRNIVGPQPTVTKNGRNAVEGTCSMCGMHLFRFVAG